MSVESSSDVARRYARWLWLLTALFVARVVAQPVALASGWRGLPSFESWHSGTVPYPVLVGSQLLIVAWLLHTARGFSEGDVVPNRQRGLALLVAGDLYFTAMVLRLILGATILREQRWFASPLPTVFHLVLATFLLLYGWFHFRHGSEFVR